MKVGILGTGDVGNALAIGFAAIGYEVMLGSRDPNQEKIKAAILKIGNSASAGTFADAAKFGDIAVLATPWSGTENAINLAGAENLSGKTVIDVTNPLDFSSGAPRLSVGFDDSAGERVQKWLPNCHVVKAFNIIGNVHMFMPKFEEGTPDMFICGNDESSKGKVTEILHKFGWEGVIDIGGIDGARLLEPLAMLWIVYAMRTKSSSHAIKLLHK